MLEALCARAAAATLADVGGTGHPHPAGGTHRAPPARSPHRLLRGHGGGHDTAGGLGRNGPLRAGRRATQRDQLKVLSRPRRPCRSAGSGTARGVNAAVGVAGDEPSSCLVVPTPDRCTRADPRAASHGPAALTRRGRTSRRPCGGRGRPRRRSGGWSERTSRPLSCERGYIEHRLMMPRRHAPGQATSGTSAPVRRAHGVRGRRAPELLAAGDGHDATQL